ncbi:hypothetical protein GGI12_003809 [Dipsacomyces acuminosporus]|nr:hypothetical protein GGI12_003809 [Dipsacomyces acuminosporus]
MTIALGPAVSERLDKDLGVQLGDHVELAVDTIGTIANAVIAVGVSEIRTQSGPRQPVAEGIPHITIAYNEPAGYRPVYAANIRHWKPLRPEQLVLKGTIREHMLTTASIVRPELKADEVSIGRLVCQFWPNLKGKDIGLAVAEARGRMAKQGVENLEANRGTITDIVRALF